MVATARLIDEQGNVMANHRKFQLGDVAQWDKPIEGVEDVASIPYWVVIVDYKQDGTGRGRDRVRTTHPVSGAGFGEAVWVETSVLIPLDVPNRPRAVRIYKANSKLEERGCSCQCCAHESIPERSVRKGGYY